MSLTTSTSSFADVFPSADLKDPDSVVTGVMLLAPRGLLTPDAVIWIADSRFSRGR